MKDQKSQDELLKLTISAKRKYQSRRFIHLWNEKLIPLQNEKEVYKYIDWEWDNKVQEKTKRYMIQMLDQEHYDQLEVMNVYSQSSYWKQYRQHVHQLVESYREETRQRIRHQTHQDPKSTQIKKKLKKIDTEKEEIFFSESQSPRNNPILEEKHQNNHLENKEMENENQILEQDSISEPLQRQSTTYGDKSKMNKEGWTWVRYCHYCQHQHKNRLRVINHKKNCKKRKVTKKIQKQRKQQRTKSQYSLSVMKNKQVFQIIKEKHSEMEIQLLEENRKLREEIQSLRGAVKQSKQDLKLQSQKMALQIIQSTKDTILESITSKLTFSIHKALTGGKDIYGMISQIRTKLVSQINYFNTDSLVNPGNSILERLHNQLIAHSSNKTKRTIFTYEESKQFFEEFTDFDLYHQSRIIFKMAHAPKRERDVHYRYYHKLRKLQSTLPILLEIDSNLPWKQISSIVPFPKVLKQLSDLITEDNFRTVTDMYTYLCLGLLPPQLKTVKLFTSSGNGALLIRIKEMKTNRIVIRYIPKPLIKLLKCTKVSLPMQDQRIFQISEQFYQKNRPFSSLRHYHSLNLIETLHYVFGNSFFFGYKKGQHFMLTDQVIQKLDQIYTFNFPQELDIIQEQVMLDLVENKEIVLEEFNRMITIDENQSFTEGYEKDFFMRKMGPSVLEEIRFQSSKEKQFIHQKCLVYQQFRKEILKKNFFTSISDFFISYLKDQQCINCLIEEMERRGEVLSEKQIIRTAARYINKAIVTTFIDMTIEIHLPAQTYEYKPYKAIIIAGNQEGIHLLDQQISEEELKQYHTNIQKTLKQNNEKNTLSQVDPKCMKCKKGKLKLQYSVQSMFRGFFICNICQSEVNEVHHKLVTFKPKQSVTIKSHREDIIDCHLLELPVWKFINNFKEETQRLLGIGSYSVISQYTEDIPEEIYCNYSRFSQIMVKKIKYNRENEQLLPLEIKNSYIESAGKGIFTLTDIPEDTLLLSYIGTMASNFTCDMRSDSLFTLGFIKGTTPRQLLITDQPITNGGRFFNSCDTERKANCKPMIGILDNHEIGVILISTKQIKEGEELLYEYGKKYWDNQNKKERK